jgi:prefoldin beta subunit
MKVDKETENQIQELQIFEKNLQAILMQKQAFQMELSEIENALQELENAKTEEVYKIAGSIMIKSEKEALIKELKQKKDPLNLRLKSLENQEKSISETSENLRKKILSKIEK